MLIKLFSREQLAKLALHTASINAVLTEALLTAQKHDEPFEPDGEEEIDLEIHIVGRCRESEPTRCTQKE